MKAFLIYINQINVLSTVLGTSAASANIIKQGKSLFLKKESLNYFLSCVSWDRKGARRKQKSLFFLVTPNIQISSLSHCQTRLRQCCIPKHYELAKIDQHQNESHFFDSKFSLYVTTPACCERLHLVLFYLICGFLLFQKDEDSYAHT